ncbi:hypothetical protein [Cellulomonas sp. NPDC089187]|uniref:hypothetical protein n=1 Tax=Cellulomonas sp. NPDC089187 TaxID=3154970 RepID=UPI003416F87D
MNDVLVVRLRADVRSGLDATFADIRRRRRHAWTALAWLWTGTIAFVALAVVLRSGGILGTLLLITVATLPWWLLRAGRRREELRPRHHLSEVAFSVRDGEVRIERQVVADKYVLPEVVWPAAQTQAALATLPRYGVALVLEGPDGARRSFPPGYLDTDPDTIIAALTDHTR